MAAKLNVEVKTMLDLGSLVDFMAESKGIDYSEAENMLPEYVFEGAHIASDSDEEEWNKEVIQYLKTNNISSVEVFQDC